jgi:two-component system phosphate regulon sensor histidine kinase PhoR
VLDFWLRTSLPVVYSTLFAGLLWMLFSLRLALCFLILMLLVILLNRAWHLYKLIQWLNDPHLENIPEGDGSWGEVYSKLSKMVKRHRQTRMELATELLEIELATAALPDGVVSLNAVNRIEWCNPLAELHFGLNAKRDILQDISYLVRQPEFTEYLNGRNFNHSLVIRAMRHDDMILSIKLIPYGVNKRLLISRDITQLERIENMRRDFVANVSHELRTPLTVVNGFVENLQDMPGLSHDKIQRALYLMAEQTQRMDHLVADLLTLSRLESDQSPLKSEMVDMQELMINIYRDMQMLSAGRHLCSIDIKDTCNLSGNQNELRSAFSNLVSNAVRYTPDGGSIKLSWVIRHGEPVFSVQDSGIGIEAEHVPRLTERFYRVDRSRSRETGGTGLGLAIVKHIAMRHQAHLEVISEQGCGSTFSLVFPVKRIMH